MPPVRRHRHKETIEKKMRKGTRSCVACRRRKVRCIFSSDQAKVCIHCSRRGSVCVPQGVQATDSTTPETTQDQASSKEDITPTEALQRLRTRVDQSLRRADEAFLPEEQTSHSKAAEPVQTDCAPVIKLFDNGVITHFVNSGNATVDGPYRDTTDPNAPVPPRHAHAVHGLCAALPPENELTDIICNRSDWWDAWRESYGLFWGDETDSTLYAFAITAFCCGDPALLGSLLVCLAFSVGTFEKYLRPVERWILHDDELAGCEHGLQCLMGLGLCFFSAMQPRKAWSVYRRANGLLQLNGIHRTHRKSEKLDSIFWQLFHADRWMSLMIGLPYSAPDDLCDLYITPADEASLVTFHYRHLAVLTGRVIDCLQALNGPSLSAIARVNEQIDAVASHLPHGYLDIAQVSACQNPKEKYARIFRLAHVHQLKASLHLPLFLQRSDEAKREYGQLVSVNSSRTLLEAFLEVYDDNPTRAGMDNNIKLTGFSAFAAAVTLFLYLLDGGYTTTDKPVSPRQVNEYDEDLVSRTMAALDHCSGNEPSSLCGQCHTALAGLISICQEMESGVTHRIALPFFGIVSIGSKPDRPNNGDGHDLANSSAGQNICGNEPSAPAQHTISDILDLPIPVDDIFWDYHGPLMINGPLQPSLPVDNQEIGVLGTDWGEMHLPFNWEHFS